MQVKPCHGSQGLSSPPDTHMTWRCLPEKKVDKIKKIFVKWGFRAVICTTDILARHTRIGDRKMQSYHRKAEKGKVALSRVEICHCRRCNFFWQMSCLLSSLVIWWRLLKLRTFFLAATTATSSRMAKDPLLFFKKCFVEWFIDKGDRQYAKAFNQGQRAEACWNISSKYLKGF